MSSDAQALPKEVLAVFKDRLHFIDDTRRDIMRRIIRDKNLTLAWRRLSSVRKGKNEVPREVLVSTLYNAIYEAGWILQRGEMMTRGEARKIVEGLELLAKYEEAVFLSASYPFHGKQGTAPLFLLLLEKYRLRVKDIPTGARRRPEAQSLATRLCAIFRKAVGAPCHEATAAIIRAALGGHCDAETVRTYLSVSKRQRK